MLESEHHNLGSRVVDSKHHHTVVPVITATLYSDHLYNGKLHCVTCA